MSYLDAQPGRPGAGQPDDSLKQVGADLARTIVTRIAPPAVLLALMWLVRAADAVLPARLTSFGVRAWDFGQLYGIAAAPVLHASWAHLLANSVPFLILGALISAQGVKKFWLVTGIVTLISGVGVFVLNAPGTVTVGASGLVFGYFGYLALAALFAPTWKSRILLGGLGLVVIGLYGTSILIGLVPRDSGISWQGHLTGFAGGVVAAWLLAPKAVSRPRSQGGQFREW